MTPITGLSEIRRLPRLGRIRLGIKKEGQKGPYPSPTDYFVCPDEVKAVFQDQPKELKVMFPNDDLELVAPQFMKCYSYSQGLICRGDGKHCKRKADTETGDFANKNTREWVLTDGSCEPEHCPMVGTKQCRKVMSLLFILPDVPGLGVYQLDTSSFYSIVNLNSQLAPDGFLRHFTNGRIAFIPLILSVGPQEVTPPGVGRKTVHVLSVRADVKLADIIRISRQKPAQILLPTLSEEEPPEDLFPEDILFEELTAPTEEKAVTEIMTATSPTQLPPSDEAAKAEIEKLALQLKVKLDAEAKGKKPISSPTELSEITTDRQQIRDSVKHMKWDESKLAAYLKDRCKSKEITTIDKIPDDKVRKIAMELADWEMMI